MRHVQVDSHDGYIGASLFVLQSFAHCAWVHVCAGVGSSPFVRAESSKVEASERKSLKCTPGVAKMLKLMKMTCRPCVEQGLLVKPEIRKSFADEKHWASNRDLAGRCVQRWPQKTRYPAGCNTLLYGFCASRGARRCI